ncbi:DUF3368 domain-containing protein [Candidatus Pacearchaeota archaeon CG10_big_fil_rev_8_21_14_0_10_31_24]|nr:MAG: DUF3368 domain-containing protein [Candidatus Pacearchaeota archaeon CG10_big_fil_rev_8_21_14_0_10_31_24]
MIVSNSSPLIYLAKLRKLKLLKELFGKVFIPSEVYEEVVISGKEKSFSDAFLVEKAKIDGWLHIETINNKKEISSFPSEIDYGEAAAIILAKKKNASLLLIDDASARAIAQSFGLKVKGTIFVILQAYKNKLISKQETKSLMASLVREGFRISHELYVSVLEEIDKN